MRVVVTGASGNVGTSLLESLGREPVVDSVLGLARRAPTIDLPKVQWASADVTDADLAPLFARADALVHLAWTIQPARQPDLLHAVNVVGTRRVLAAALAARVPTVVCASSVGTYSPGSKSSGVPESWPTDGIPTSFYSRHKSDVERQLDRFEADHPELRVVRLRPALTFKRAAATGVHRLFLGPLVRPWLVDRRFVPVVPRHSRLVFQAVHTDDVAEAYRLALLGDVRGAFNIAADPVLGPEELGQLLGARPIPVSTTLLRLGADLAWRSRLVPTPPGWVDLALAAPIMGTARASRELGWKPRVTGSDALVELLAGIRERAAYPTPPLARGVPVPGSSSA